MAILGSLSESLGELRIGQLRQVNTVRPFRWCSFTGSFWFVQLGFPFASDGIQGQDKPYQSQRCPCLETRKPTCAMVLLQNIPLLSQLPDDAGKRVDVGGRGDRASELSTAGNRVVVWYTRSRHCVWSCPTTHNQWALAHPQHQCTRPDVTVCPSPTAAVSADSHGWCAPPALLSRTRARIPGLVNETARGKPTTDSARSQNTSTP